MRPLHDDHVRDANATTRDYVLELDATPDGAALLSMFGGKITTYRRLAEAALERLAPYLPSRARHRAGWTGHAPLPGGDFAVDGLAALTAALATEYRVPDASPCRAGSLRPMARGRKHSRRRPHAGRSRRLVRRDADAKPRCAT